MSYMRMGYPLIYFKGESREYVFVGGVPTKKGMKKYRGSRKLKPEDYEDCVQDYNSEYKDDCSLIELIGTIIEDETKDKKYAEKIIRILAKKLKVEHKLRKRPLTVDQWFDLANKNLEKFKKSPEGKI